MLFRSGGAVLAVPDITEVKNNINQLSDNINKIISDKISQNKTTLKHISEKQILKNPKSIYEIKGMDLDSLMDKLNFASKNIINENKTKLFRLENSIVLKNPTEITRSKREIFLKNFEKLEVLNPLKTLKRGYTLAKSNDKVISSAKDVETGDQIDIEFDDGIVNTKVI